MAAFDADYINALPKMALPTYEPDPTYGSNPLVAGFMSGGIGLAGSLAGFGGAVGRATGIEPLARTGEDWSNRLEAASQAAGLQKYETDPWSVSGLGYQAAKMAPSLLAMMAGGEVIGGAIKAPAALEALGRVAPRVLGGAGGATGEVAEKAGAEWAKHLIGGGIAGYPMMAGSAYQDQLAHGGPDQGKAALALAVGAPEAAAGAIMPAQLRALADNGLKGKLITRILTGGASAGAAGMVQAGVQGALNQPFEDPTLSFAERAKHVVQSALVQGAVGGLFGAAGSLRGGQRDSMATPEKPPGEQYGPPVQGSEPIAPAPYPLAPDRFEGFQQRRMDDATVGNQEAPLPPTPTSLEPGLPFQQRRMGEAEPLPGSPAYAPAPLPEAQGSTPYAPAPLPNLVMPQHVREADARVMNALQENPNNEAMQGVAERRGGVAPIGTPLDVLGPVQRARYEQAYPITDQGQFDAKISKFQPDAAVRILNAIADGKPGESQVTIAGKYQLLDLFDPAKEHTLSQAQVDLRQQIVETGDLKPGAVEALSKAAAPVATPAGEAPAAPVATPAPVGETRSDQKIIEDLQRPILKEAGVGFSPAVRAIAKEALALKEADPALTHEQALTEAVRQRVGPGAKGGATVEALGRKLGVLDPEGKEIPNAPKVGGTEAVDAGKPEGLAARVRGDDANGDVPAGARPEEAPQAAAPVEGPAPAPAPVEGQTATAPQAESAQPVAPAARPQGTLGLKGGAQPTGIPFMITAAMKQQLAARGSTPEEIRNMTPAQAHEILSAAPAETAPAPVEAPEQVLARQESEKNALAAQVALDQQNATAGRANMRSAELARQQAADAERDRQSGKLAAVKQVAAEAPQLSSVEPREGGVAPKAESPAIAAMRQATANIAAKTSTMEQGVVAMANSGGDAKDALAHIAQTSPLKSERDMAAHLLAAAKDAGLKMPMTVGIDETVRPGWSAASSYNKQSGVITLGRQENSAQDLMHEVSHALTAKAADRNTQGWAELRSVFKGISQGTSAADRNDPTMRYAFEAPVPEGATASQALDLRTREFLAEVHSNPNLQAYLKAQAPSTWQRVKNAFYHMVGVDGKVMRNAYDKVMDISKQVFDEAKALKLTNGEDAPAGQEPLPGSIPHALDVIQNKLFPFADIAKSVIQKKFDDVSGDPVSLGQKMRKFGLGWADADELLARFDKMLGGYVSKWVNARKYGRGITDRLAQMALPVRDAAIQVARANPAANKIWDGLRGSSASYGYDYRKWANDQPKVFENMSPERAANLRAFVDDAKRQWDSISGLVTKADDGQRFLGQIDNNIKHIQTLDAVYRDRFSDRNVPEFSIDPVMEVTQHADMIKDLPGTAAYTRKALESRLSALETLGAAQAPDVLAMQARKKAIDDQIETLAGGKTQADIKAMQNAIAQMKANDGDPAVIKSLSDRVKQLKSSRVAPDEKTREAIKAAKAESSKTHEELQALTDYQSDITKLVSGYRQSMKSADQQPFFHLGREGDHFVSMRLKADDTGVPVPEATARLAQLLQAKNLDGISIDQMNENNHFFTRLDTPTQRDQVERIAATLKKEGLLAPDAVDKDGNVTERAYKAGEVAHMESAQFNGIAPAAVQRLLSVFKADHADLPDDVSNALMKHMRSIYLDMLPKNSLVRLFAPRQGVMGYRKDMTANFDQYHTQFSHASGRMWSQPRVMDALSGMTKAVAGHQEDINSGGLKDVASAAAREIMKRETGNTPVSNSKLQRNVLAANHIYYLTLSPAYTTELMMQIPTLLLPQLGRKYGYVQSAGAIARSVSPAMKVVRALIDSGHGSDGFITPEALRKAGLSEDQIDVTMKTANRGGLEFGSWTKAMVGDAPSIARSEMMQRLNTFTVASEVLPRAMAMFSAADLHAGDNGVKARLGLHDYIDETLAGSTYNWQTDLQARHLGAGGFAGPLTPLVTKFMSFQTKTMHRLYREVDTAFGSMADERASSPEEAQALKTEARRFLLGHLSAVTLLAGSLGLPILPVAASAASSLANFLTGDDRYDAEKWYRSHLIDAFGPTAAEAMTKGVPRLLGMDLSGHAGEERLLPFSDMLTDKRKWSDVLDSASFHAFGSPLSMVGNALKGGTHIYNGQVLNGMQEMLPSAAKNFARAFRMGTNGYETPNGVKLPLDNPSAVDVGMQVLGITPAKKAAYDETEEALHGLQDRRRIITQNLGANMVSAYNHHDPEAIKAARANSLAFVQTHPWMANELISPLQHAIQQQAMGRMFGAIGVNPRDQGQRSILRAYGGMP